MSEAKRFSGNRKIWIGGSVAAAAVVVAVSAGLFPPNASDTAGTIVPAQRYQATPISATDIKLGTSGNATVSGASGNPTGVANAGAGLLTFNNSFGAYNNANSNFIYNPRQIQLGARFNF